MPLSTVFLLGAVTQTLSSSIRSWFLPGTDSACLVVSTSLVYCVLDSLLSIMLFSSKAIMDFRHRDFKRQ